ncbi:MAG: type IV pilus modification PilV family protein [Kiritimatiellia bacterium]
MTIANKIMNTLFRKLAFLNRGHPRSSVATMRARRAGFTLMEVNMALLIMAIGLLGLFSLFPVGMRQSAAASSDSTQAAFADLVLNAMRANAQMVTNWSGPNGWAALTNGVNLGVAGSSSPAAPGQKVLVPTVAAPLPTGVQVIGDGAAHKIGDALGDGYLVKGQYIEYKLLLEFDSNPLILKASIKVSTRRFTNVDLSPTYATSFVYMGM